MSNAATFVSGGIAKFEFDLDGDGSYETDNGTNPRRSRTFAAATISCVSG